MRSYNYSVSTLHNLSSPRSTVSVQQYEEVIASVQSLIPAAAAVAINKILIETRRK